MASAIFKNFTNAGIGNKFNNSGVQQQNMEQAFSELKKIGTRPSVDRSQQSSMGFLEKQVNPQILDNYNTAEMPRVNQTMGKGFWGSSQSASNDMSQDNLQSNMSQIAAKQKYGDEQARQALSEGMYGRRLGALQAAGNASTAQTFDIVKNKSTLDKLAELTGAAAGGAALYKNIMG